MTDTVTAPAVIDDGTRTTIHRIGKLVVTVELPADCPEPHVAVQLFTTQTSERDRAALLTALGTDGGDVKTTDDLSMAWVEALGDADMTAYQHGRARAVVFLDPEDNITDPLTRAERFGQLTER